MDSLTCSVCGYPYRRRDGFAGVSLSKGETELDQMRNWQRFEVCGECSDVLKSWLGVPVEPRTRTREDDPVRPYSLCADERLEFP